MFSVAKGRPNTVSLSFTDLPMQGRPQLFFDPFSPADLPMVTVTDCRWHAVSFSMHSPYFSAAYCPQIVLQNNLFERCLFSLYSEPADFGGGVVYQVPLNLSLYNNLFWSNRIANLNTTIGFPINFFQQPLHGALGELQRKRDI